VLTFEGVEEQNVTTNRINNNNDDDPVEEVEGACRGQEQEAEEAAPAAAAEAGNADNAAPSAPLSLVNDSTEDPSRKKEKKKRKLEELEISDQVDEDDTTKKKQKNGIAPEAAPDAEEKEDVDKDYTEEIDIIGGGGGGGGFGDSYREHDDDGNTKGGGGGGTAGYDNGNDVSNNGNVSNAGDDGDGLGTENAGRDDQQASPARTEHLEINLENLQDDYFDDGVGEDSNGGGDYVVDDDYQPSSAPSEEEEEPFSDDSADYSEGAGNDFTDGGGGVENLNGRSTQASAGLPARTILVAKRLTASDLGKNYYIKLPRVAVETNLSFAIPALDHPYILRLLDYASTPPKTWQFHLSLLKFPRVVYVLEKVSRYIKHHALKVNDVLAISKSTENGKLLIEINTEEAYTAAEAQHGKFASRKIVSQVHHIYPSFTSNEGGGGGGGGSTAEVDNTTAPGVQGRRTILVAKKLNTTDLSYGRVVLPRAAVEENLSFAKEGHPSHAHAIVVRDSLSSDKSWTFTIQSWVNGNRGSNTLYRMHQVLEYIRHHRLEVEDVIGILRDDENGEFVVQHNTPELRRVAKVYEEAALSRRVSCGKQQFEQLHQFQREQQQQQLEERNISVEHASPYSADGTATPPPTKSLQVDDKGHVSNSGSKSGGNSPGKTGTAAAAGGVVGVVGAGGGGGDDVEMAHLNVNESPTVQIITAGDQQILVSKPSSAVVDGDGGGGGGGKRSAADRFVGRVAAGVRQSLNADGGLHPVLKSGINGRNYPRLPVLPQNRLTSAPPAAPPPAAHRQLQQQKQQRQLQKKRELEQRQEQLKQKQQQQQQQFTPLRITSRPAEAPTAAPAPSGAPKQPLATITRPSTSTKTVANAPPTNTDSELEPVYTHFEFSRLLLSGGEFENFKTIGVFLYDLRSETWVCGAYRHPNQNNEYPIPGHPPTKSTRMDVSQHQQSGNVEGDSGSTVMVSFPGFKPVHAPPNKHSVITSGNGKISTARMKDATFMYFTDREDFDSWYNGQMRTRGQVAALGLRWKESKDLPRLGARGSGSGSTETGAGGNGSVLRWVALPSTTQEQLQQQPQKQSQKFDVLQGYLLQSLGGGGAAAVGPSSTAPPPGSASLLLETAKQGIATAAATVLEEEAKMPEEIDDAAMLGAANALTNLAGSATVPPPLAEITTSHQNPGFASARSPKRSKKQRNIPSPTLGLPTDNHINVDDTLNNMHDYGLRPTGTAHSLDIGSEVEIRWFDEGCGVRGSWYIAKIIDIMAAPAPAPHFRFYRVECLELFNSSGEVNDPVREWMPLAVPAPWDKEDLVVQIRVLPKTRAYHPMRNQNLNLGATVTAGNGNGAGPSTELSTYPRLHQGQRIEAYWGTGWWMGFVRQIKSNGTKIEVDFDEAPMGEGGDSVTLPRCEVRPGHPQEERWFGMLEPGQFIYDSHGGHVSNNSDHTNRLEVLRGVPMPMQMEQEQQRPYQTHLQQQQQQQHPNEPQQSPVNVTAPTNCIPGRVTAAPANALNRIIDTTSAGAAFPAAPNFAIPQLAQLPEMAPTLPETISPNQLHDTGQLMERYYQHLVLTGQQYREVAGRLQTHEENLISRRSAVRELQSKVNAEVAEVSKLEERVRNRKLDLTALQCQLQSAEDELRLHHEQVKKTIFDDGQKTAVMVGERVKQQAEEARKQIEEWARKVAEAEENYEKRLLEMQPDGGKLGRAVAEKATEILRQDEELVKKAKELEENKRNLAMIENKFRNDHQSTVKAMQSAFGGSNKTAAVAAEGAALFAAPAALVRGNGQAHARGFPSLPLLQQQQHQQQRPPLVVVARPASGSQPSPLQAGAYISTAMQQQQQPMQFVPVNNDSGVVGGDSTVPATKMEIGQFPQNE